MDNTILAKPGGDQRSLMVKVKIVWWKWVCEKHRNWLGFTTEWPDVFNVFFGYNGHASMVPTIGSRWFPGRFGKRHWSVYFR